MFARHVLLVFSVMLGQQHGDVAAVSWTPGRTLVVQPRRPPPAGPRGVPQPQRLTQHACGRLLTPPALCAGRQLQAQVFLNPTYYQRLKHMVDFKIHSRQRGPLQVGVARAGGRAGEREGGRPEREGWRVAPRTATRRVACGGFGEGRSRPSRNRRGCPRRQAGACQNRPTHVCEPAPAGAQPAAGGGPRARRRPAVRGDGARLHHQPRRRRLPQGASERD